jgi:2-keto-4-pentenoate hydratase/2-oxohepta-3-ene-1,7-dioic acid hydratase in catechol pathway
LIANLPTLLPAMKAATAGGKRHALSDVTFLSPVPNPNKIIGIAGNRKNRDSDKLDFGEGVELNNTRREADPPRMFLKANSALIGPSAGIVLRFLNRRTDPEAEFTAIIGRGGTDIPLAEALDHVACYSIGLDMTLRGSEPPSTRKSIDTYAVLGPWMVTADEVPDPCNVGYTLHVNGEERQRSNTNNFAHSIAEVIAHASLFFTLMPGDVIMGGSPLGFAPVVPGDFMVAEFDHIGKMEIHIRAHEGPSA